ncbi:hypothetical protein HBB16_16220 [Pseudonocardia sp. MCCB 268]|nr:hypothetical protein [Pseudonocardia cytotoxica]
MNETLCRPTQGDPLPMAAGEQNEPQPGAGHRVRAAARHRRGADRPSDTGIR